MTTATAIKSTASVTRSVGRPLSKRGRCTKAALERFLNQVEGTFTVADLRKVSKQSKVTVRNHVSELQRRGVIVPVGSAPNPSKRGRPQTVFRKAEAPSKVNPTVRKHRERLRELAEMSPQERREYVSKALVNLYQKQVKDEREVGDSLFYNRQGFTKYDAPRGTEHAERILNNEALSVAEVNYWLTPVSKTGRTRIGKYERQL